MPGVESGRLSWAAPLRNVAGCEAHWPQSPEGAFAIFDSATPAVLHGLVTGESSTWLPAGLLSGHEMVRVVTNPTPVAPLKRRGDTLVRPAELQLSWAEAVKTLVDGTRRHYAYASAVSLDHSPKVRDALPLHRALHLAGDALQRSNLWLNPPHKGMRSALHYDGHDNLLVQLRGEKEVLLFPPELHVLLRYRPRSEHVYSNATGSDVAGRPSLSFETHSPRSGRGGATLENHAALAVFADEEVLHLEGEAGAPSDEEWARLVPHARICTLRPGQTLFLPALWSHAVVSGLSEDETPMHASSHAVVSGLSEDETPMHAPMHVPSSQVEGTAAAATCSASDPAGANCAASEDGAAAVSLEEVTLEVTSEVTSEDAAAVSLDEAAAWPALNTAVNLWFYSRRGERSMASFERAVRTSMRGDDQGDGRGDGLEEGSSGGWPHAQYCYAEALQRTGRVAEAARRYARAIKAEVLSGGGPQWPHW